VQGGVAPGHELAVVPDHAVEAVIGSFSHGASSSDLALRLPAGFLRRAG
jgi:hypothetical protein